MSKAITPDVRKQIAARVGINEQYLYQCLTGRREMSAAEARRVETESGEQVRRWHLCQKTWHLIWPELIGQVGAPPVPQAAPARAVGVSLVAGGV